MTQALVHRGPDGNAVAVSSGMSLGHARLAILDPRPEGDQPMWNHDRTIAIVFNGEIYNYRALRDAEKLPCTTGTDTEVLLRLYEKHGIDCVTWLRGMFAFAIADTRTGTLHLVRDPMGIKPLYTATINGALHFASEMRVLMQVLATKPTLDERSLARFLRLQYVPGPTTMCQGIESVPPGTIITACQGKETRRSFRTQIAAVPYFASRRECAAYLPELFDAVVREQLVSDRPVGLFLSGGMDSSILLHHMARQTSHAIRTFTVRFEATEEEGAARFNTDADLAKHTAEYYGTEHTELLITAADFRDAYAATAEALDQPNADHVSVAQYLLAKRAKASVDVVLTGAGGDELFGGYPRYRIGRILHTIRWMPPYLRRIAARAMGYPPDVLAMTPSATLLARLLARPHAEWTALTRGDWFDTADDTNTWFAERWKEHATREPLRRMMETDRATWLIDESLRLVDGTTMASGLEARVPFLDPLIIDTALATPATWHVGWRRTKTLLKDAYQDLLPPHLFSLAKASFYPPLAKWLRRECGELVSDALRNPLVMQYCQIPKIEAVMQRHQSKEQYGLHVLHAIIQLAAWHARVYQTNEN